jgi:hypothetical protein
MNPEDRIRREEDLRRRTDELEDKAHDKLLDAGDRLLGVGERAVAHPYRFLVKFIVGLMLVGAVISLIGWGLGWFSEAGKVAKEEFGPQAALEKYQWFISQANAIDKMNTDIGNFEKRVTAVEKQYVGSYGTDKTKWTPDVRVLYNRENQLARDDLLAVVTQRNNLVKEYNAQSQKFNWAPFRTRSDMPSEQLQEYKSLSL